METFEDFAIFILLVFYAVIWYLAGRANLFKIIPLMTKERIIELEKNIKKAEEEEKALAEMDGKDG